MNLFVKVSTPSVRHIRQGSIPLWCALCLTLSLSLSLCPISAVAAPTDLDAGFGQGGKQFVDIGPQEAPNGTNGPQTDGNNHAAAMALQSDGKIVVAGIASNGYNRDFALARLNNNGSLDATFDGNGKLLLPMSEGFDRALAVVMQSDQKIVVAGFADTDPDPERDTRGFAVARLNTNGSLDTSFGRGGKVVFSMGSDWDFVNAIAMQSDGKIILAGNMGDDIEADFAVARLNPNGSLDNSFDGDGKCVFSMGPDGDRINAVTVQRDGKIVVAGAVAYGDSQQPGGANGTTSDFGVARLNANGSLDSTYGNGGKFIFPMSDGYDRPLAIELQSDGKSLVTGGADGAFAVARLDSGGTLDSSFGSGGKVTFKVSDGPDTARGIALQRNGKIILAGRADGEAVADFGLARLNPDGTLDAGFDGDGKFILPMSSEGDGAQAVAVQPNGKIVVVGYATLSNMDFAIARILGDLPELTVNDAPARAEGNPGSPASTTFTVTLLPASNRTVTVSYHTADGTATAGQDYIAKSGTLTFAPGVTTRQVTVSFIGDSVAELNESFFLHLKTPVGASVADSRGSAFIKNDDGPQIAIADAAPVVEGNSGTTPQTFTVSLSASSSDTVTVDWATVNNTAGLDDFVAARGTLTFPPGVRSRTITVQVKGDTLTEPFETYWVTLQRPLLAVVADSRGTGAIKNDDGTASVASQNSQAPSE